MRSTLRKPTKPVGKTSALARPSTVEKKKQVEVSKIPPHATIKGASKNLYSPRNYTSVDDEELGMPVEDLPMPVEDTEEDFSANAESAAQGCACAAYKSVASASHSKELPLREYSPRRLVLSVEKTKSLETELLDFGWQAQYALSGEKVNYLFLKNKEDLCTYLRLKKSEAHNVPYLTTCTKIEVSPYSSSLQTGSLAACQPECLGVALCTKSICTFVGDKDSESYQAPEAHTSHLPVPVVGWEEMKLYPQQVQEALKKVSLRLEQHVLVECDDHLENLTQAYTRLHQTMLKLMALTDALFEQGKNKHAAALLGEGCQHLPQVLLNLEQANSILSLANAVMDVQTEQSGYPLQ